MNIAQTLFQKLRTPARRRRSLTDMPVTAASVESLEERTLLAAAAIELTPNEQLLLELVNRARANPEAEAVLYGINLNQGLPANTISADAKQPLAPNQLLVDVAQDHSQDMLDRNYFAHTAPPPGHPGGAAYNPNNPPAGSVTFDQRITDSGYNWQYVGENIAWAGVAPASFSIDEIQYVYDLHEDLFLSPGHRKNILEGAFRELGTGVQYGYFTNPGNGTTYNSGMVSEEFGNPWGNGFITGVVFEDGRGGLADDDFYTIGEQVGSGTIEAVSSTGQVYSITIGPSGGYALQVPNGTYTLTASGDAVGGTYIIGNVVVSGGRNVKVDFDTSEAPTPVSADSIIGRLADGRVWIAVSDGTTFSNELWVTLPAGTNWQDMQVGDFTGDGKQDIAARDNDGDWWVWTAGTGGFTGAEWGSRWSTSLTWSDISVGDFNGDGLDDIAGRAANGRWYFAESDGNGFGKVSSRVWSVNNTWSDVKVGDFNGDGTDDIAGRAENGMWLILRSDGSGNSHTNIVGGTWSPNAQWTDVLVGDFDGNGNDDVIGRAGNGAWYVGYWNGNGFSTAYVKTWTNNVTWHDVLVGDFNGDGRDDIAGRASSGRWYTMQTTSGTGAAAAWTINYNAGQWSPNTSWINVVAGDFNGDGLTDIAGRAGNALWYVGLSTGSGFTHEHWGGWTLVHTWHDVQRIRVT